MPLYISRAHLLGISRRIVAFFSGLSWGEVDSITRLIYDARNNCLAHIHDEATTLGTDAVIGVKVFIHEIGSSFVEAMAIGTAIKRNSQVRIQVEQLIPQVVIRGRDTFIDATFQQAGKELERK